MTSCQPLRMTVLLVARDAFMPSCWLKLTAGPPRTGEAMLSRRREGAASSGCALVIGLGGGGLPVFLHRFLGMSVEAVELDEAVVGLARRHFGFQEESGLQVSISRAMCLRLQDLISALTLTIICIQTS